MYYFDIFFKMAILRELYPTYYPYMGMPAKVNMYPFCKALPKVELHAHLNGCLSVTTLRELGCPEMHIAMYSKLKDLITRNQKALDVCFKVFQIAHDVTNNPQAVYIATKRVIEEFFYDNVIYLELRTTPRSEQNMTKEDYIEAVIKAIYENKNDITVKLILSINRSHCVNNSQDSLRTILKMRMFYPSIIKGIDLSGNPKEGRFEAEIFKAAKENHLFTTVHCGEVKNDEEVREILNFQPDRLGHATFLHPNYGGHNENWTLYKEKKIPTEMCITSNIICETVSNYSLHHVREWLKNKLPFCISTDDKGMFCTELSKEFEHLHNYYKVTKEEMWQISLNSIDYSFASPAEKLHLKARLAEWKQNSEHFT